MKERNNFLAEESRAYPAENERIFLKFAILKIDFGKQEKVGKSFMPDLK